MRHLKMTPLMMEKITFTGSIEPGMYIIFYPIFLKIG